jgi:hypothetical protein
MKIFKILLLLTVFTRFDVYSQEILQGLSVNPVIIEKLRTDLPGSSGVHPFGMKTASDTIPVWLPFIDDFSTLAVFPSAQRWIDRYAFENDDYPVFPVNIGAVTLDAVNDSGRMYPEATPGPATFIADHLTSRYIRLDSVQTPAPKSLTPADSVYLSFYYQPQGRGRAPQYNDSLVLQFLLKPGYDSLGAGGSVIHVPDRWTRVWYSNGMPLDTFYVKNNRWFTRVMIPITDPVFFTKKFRFRFFNYVSLASSAEPSWQSNTDQWNIDQVYLNVGRNLYDSIYPEIRFVQRPAGLLSRYTSMPYPQYSDNPTNELRDTLDVLMSNRSVTPKMSTYGYQITQQGTSFLKNYDGGNYNIQPFHVNPYVTYQKFAHPEMPFLLPVGNSDSTVFYIRHTVRETGAGTTLGDTISTSLKLYNYFAYDDGTPEASYGLTPSGAKLAYSFKLNKSPDTLRAVRIYFNQTLSDASERRFFLCVWNDNAGKPGDTIYSQLVTPKYADSLNKFVTYHLTPPVAVTGTFYVGWIQVTNDNLSVGFDRYNNNQKSIFFNTSGNWMNSAFAGSLLIRPVVGKPIPLGVQDEKNHFDRITLYPNPVNGDRIFLKYPVMSHLQTPYRFYIHDQLGRVVLEGSASSSVFIGNLTPGIYFLELRSNGNQRVAGSRFIVIH